ncbi:unnamed protein product [Somion occarium]|uniref:Uncharacterized protein n=1 Tax=Somion occarium TaxID=3059160 RepID=A0ABP1CGF9_9APHY
MASMYNVTRIEFGGRYLIARTECGVRVISQLFLHHKVFRLHPQDNHKRGKIFLSPRTPHRYTNVFVYQLKPAIVQISLISSIDHLIRSKSHNPVPAN